MYQKRIDILQELFKVCDQMGLKTSFHMYYPFTYNIGRSAKRRPFELEERLNEEQYYDMIADSKAVVDIVEPDHPWMTQRPMEALYFKKKLISNNIDLLQEPLYHPNNVFLLGKDSLNDLPDFLTKPFIQHKKEVYEFYTIEAWISRFDEI